MVKFGGRGLAWRPFCGRAPIRRGVPGSRRCVHLPARPVRRSPADASAHRRTGYPDPGQGPPQYAGVANQARLAHRSSVESVIAVFLLVIAAAALWNLGRPLVARNGAPRWLRRWLAEPNLGTAIVVSLPILALVVFGLVALIAPWWTT